MLINLNIILFKFVFFSSFVTYFCVRILNNKTIIVTIKICLVCGCVQINMNSMYALVQYLKFI